MGGFPVFRSFLIKPGAVDDVSGPKTILLHAMGSNTMSDIEIPNPPPNSVSTLKPVDGGVSEENSVAFSSFGLSGCSFWVRLCVREVEEATGDVCVKKIGETLRKIFCNSLCGAYICVFRFFLDSRRLRTLQRGYASGRVDFTKLSRRCIKLGAHSCGRNCESSWEKRW